MRSVLVTTLAVFTSLGALACGPSSDKPPLTPDTDQHPPAELGDGGAAAPSASTPEAK